MRHLIPAACFSTRPASCLLYNRLYVRGATAVLLEWQLHSVVHVWRLKQPLLPPTPSLQHALLACAIQEHQSDAVPDAVACQLIGNCCALQV
jgi:hypothetical protein